MKSKTSNYQDFGAGGRDCEVRYGAIKECLPRDRTISILDVGSNMGFFSLSIARDFPCLVYSIEHRKADLRFHIEHLRKSGAANNYVFRALLDKQIVSRLFDRSEVFDVTLLLSVVHHFHYPFEQWSEMVGSFVKHSALTFFELPSLQDEPDIAALEKFRSWYQPFGSQPYEGLLRQMLKVANLGHCEVRTIRGSVQGSRSKETRHLILVNNPAVSVSAPRFHCLSIWLCSGLFLEYPESRYWREQVQDFRRWCAAFPSRLVNRLRRLWPR